MSRTLYSSLFDDAAVFPPGNAPLPIAVADHRAHRVAAHAELVGPLLLPAAAHAELMEVVGDDPRPLAVRLISRPGSQPAPLLTALDQLTGHPAITVVGAEFGWYAGWREQWAGRLPLAIEIPRGADSLPAIEGVRAAHLAGCDVAAKFRTGPTPTWPWPDEPELAGFLATVARAGIPFKLTGGLHHAIRGSYAPAGGASEQNHGLLNVLVATRAALDGASLAEIAEVLSIDDATVLARIVHQWPEDTIAAVRSAFVSYGCCTVTDPIGELEDLGLLPTTPAPTLTARTES